MSDQPKKEKQLSSATIVDLKNELYRKRTEFDYQKVSSSSQITEKKLHEILKQGTEDWHKKPPIKDKQATKPSEPEPEEAGPNSEALARTRAVLERKAALYDRLAKGEQDPSDFQGDGDDEEGYLVDFDRKLVTSSRRSPLREDYLSSSSSFQKQSDGSTSEDWTEYVDGRGYKRRCLKSDLEELRDQQKRIRTDDQLEAISRRSDLLSRDDMRELERQRWEAQARNAMHEDGDEEQEGEQSGESYFESREPVGPLHYSHISAKETRQHGVGYFAFSGDETERQQQMEALNKLHNQTEEQRRKAAGVKASREALKNARLAKVLERRRQKQDLSEIEASGNVDDDEKEEATVATTPLGDLPNEGAPSKPVEPTTSKPSTDDRNKISWPGQNELRDWDRGKNVPSAPGAWQRAVDERRGERPSEFAPPSAYNRKSK